MVERIIENISGNIHGKVCAAEPLSAHTTYQVGGKAEIFVCPDGSEGAAWVYEYAIKGGIPLTVLGWGSNVIVPDEGLEGIVLKMKNPSAGIDIESEELISVEAGVSLIDLARHTAKEGLCGLEPVAGIPGTIGGAVLMNAGTNDGDMSQIVVSVEVMTQSGRRRTFETREMGFGYRKSIFQGSGWLILGAVLRLKKEDPVILEERIERILKERMRKFPLDEANAGSVFKRPRGDYAGRLIEQAGCKGLRIGGAMVSERHANFIVNVEEASAKDILGLIAELRRRVYEDSGIYLELEQIPLGT